MICCLRMQRSDAKLIDDACGREMSISNICGHGNVIGTQPERLYNCAPKQYD